MCWLRRWLATALKEPRRGICWAAHMSISSAASRDQRESAAANSTPLDPWCGCWSKCLSLSLTRRAGLRGGFTTHAAVPAACSFRPNGSWAGLPRDPASRRPASLHGVPRRRGDNSARFDHRQSLAAGQRLCVGNIARSRPPVSWRRLGELWYGTALAELTILGLRAHVRSEQ